MNPAIIAQLPTYFTGQRTLFTPEWFEVHWEILCDEFPPGKWWHAIDAREALMREFNYAPSTARMYLMAILRYVKLESGTEVLQHVGHRYRFRP